MALPILSLFPYFSFSVKEEEFKKTRKHLVFFFFFYKCNACLLSWNGYLKAIVKNEQRESQAKIPHTDNHC